MKAKLRQDIKFLAENQEFVSKVQQAYVNKQGESFRVYWAPIGWIMFTLDKDGVYHGWPESEAWREQTKLEAFT